MNDLNLKDMDKLADWFHDASEVWIPPAPPVKGNTRILAMFRAIFRKYNSLSWKVTEIHQLTDLRCFYFSESWGILNGQPYQNRIVTDIAFNEDGRIDHLSDYFKDTAVFIPR